MHKIWQFSSLSVNLRHVMHLILPVPRGCVPPFKLKDNLDVQMSKPLHVWPLMTPNMQLWISCSGDRGKHVFFLFDAHSTDARVCRARFFCDCCHRFVICIDTELPQSATNQLLRHFKQEKAKIMVNMQRQINFETCYGQAGWWWWWLFLWRRRNAETIIKVQRMWGTNYQYLNTVISLHWMSSLSVPYCLHECWHSTACMNTS